MVKSDLKFRMEERLTYQDVDDNFNRVAYLQGPWVAGTYTAQEVVYYQGGLWVCIATTTDVPSIVSPSWVLYTPNPGTASVELSAPIAGADIGLAWQVLDQFDTAVLTSYGITPNLTNGEIVFDWPGVWQLSLGINISHAEAQAGREVDLRAFNVTDAVGGNPYPIAIARNQPGTSQTLSLLLAVPAADVGKTWRFEIGNVTGQDLTAVVWNAQSIDFVQVTPRT